jgi:metallophosphoesterase superfamily enzyme
MAGRSWTWIAGNHDPAPLALGGTHRAEVRAGPLTFRHIAVPGATGEVSGHFHPKASVAGRSRPCFLIDSAKVILPAFGCYTGGLRASDPALAALLGPRALAILTGPQALAIPMPR